MISAEINNACANSDSLKLLDSGQVGSSTSNQRHRDTEISCDLIAVSMRGPKDMLANSKITSACKRRYLLTFQARKKQSHPDAFWAVQSNIHYISLAELEMNLKSSGMQHNSTL